MMREFVMQFGRPEGLVGRAVADAMHIAHASDYAAVLSLAPLGAGTQLLEIGMASGRHVPDLTARGVCYTGIDHSPDMVAAAQDMTPAATFICADVCNCALPRCDAAIAVNTMQWWQRPLAALRNIRLTLVRNGHLVIGVAAPPPDGLLPSVGQRHFTGAQIVTLVRAAGFARVYLWETVIGPRPYFVCGGVA